METQALCSIKEILMVGAAVLLRAHCTRCKGQWTQVSMFLLTSYLSTRTHLSPWGIRIFSHLKSPGKLFSCPSVPLVCWLSLLLPLVPNFLSYRTIAITMIPLLVTSPWLSVLWERMHLFTRKVQISHYDLLNLNCPWWEPPTPRGHWGFETEQVGTEMCCEYKLHTKFQNLIRGERM